MKQNKLIRIIFMLIVCYFQHTSSTLFAQDIHFSQFFETPLLRNPSLAGIYSGDVRVQAIFRNQWSSVTDAYKTGSLNAEYKMPVGRGNDFVTTGVEVLYDQAGTIGWTSTYLFPALNYHKSLSNDKNNYLSLGFMGGLVQRHFDRSKIITNSTYDGLGDGESLTQTQYSYLDGSVGMSYNSSIGDESKSNFYLGAAYHHFNRPNNSFYRNANIELNPKLVFSGGVKISATDYAFATIQADYSIQGSYQEAVAGFLYGLKIGEDPANSPYTIQGGMFIRWNDALIPVIKLDYAPFSVSFSYDANISKLKSSSYGRGGFEMSVSYIGFLNKDRSFENSVRSPRF